MSLMDMIEQVAGSGALQQIGARVGLSPQELQSAIGSLAPSLAPKIEQHAATGALDGTPTGEAAPAPGSPAATDHGNTILGSIFGSKDASRSVAADASAQTGISVEKIKAVLPQLASIAAVALIAHRATSGGQGGLGGLFNAFGGAGRS